VSTRRIAGIAASTILTLFAGLAALAQKGQTPAADAQQGRAQEDEVPRAGFFTRQSLRTLTMSSWPDLRLNPLPPAFWPIRTWRPTWNTAPCREAIRLKPSQRSAARTSRWNSCWNRCSRTRVNYYRLRHRETGSNDFVAGPECTFHTQRVRNTDFTFAVQADSHLDENASPDIYRITLTNALAAKPDFYLDLGDTFMTDKRPGTSGMPTRNIWRSVIISDSSAIPLPFFLFSAITTARGA